MRRRFIYNDKNIKQARVLLRKNQTLAEKCVWESLRRKLSGVKWYRQYSVGKYILDFYCPRKKLAVELDGIIHRGGEARRYDKERTDYLKLHGITVKRFWNWEVERLGEKILELL